MEISSRSVSRVIDRSVGRIAPVKSVVDKTGRDADDYRQLLRVRAWQAGQVAPDHGQDAFDRWQHAAVRNQLRTCQRELCRQPEMARYDYLPEDDRHAPSFERSMELRDLLRRLEERFGAEDWQLLQDYVAHGCNAASVWQAYGRQMSQRYFRERIRELCERCRRLVAWLR